MSKPQKARSRPRKAAHYTVEDSTQLEALASPLRLQLVDTAAALGPCSGAEMAEHLGERRESIYFHVHQLVPIGLLREVGVRSTTRRGETLYDAPGRSIRLCFDASDESNVRAHVKICSSNLRLTMRDLPAAFGARPRIKGKRRELSVARLKGWLDPDDLQRANELIDELQSLVHAGQRRVGARLCSH